eukprot:8509551-Ditylum_brightwellii.AAC.1
MYITKEAIELIAKDVLAWPSHQKWESNDLEERFRSCFGAPSNVVADIWNHIVTSLDNKINGPFVGSKNDGTIFQECLSNWLCDDEGVGVDGGYRGDAKMKRPEIGFNYNSRKEKSCAQGGHKNVNGRLKQFNILNIPFWYSGSSNEMMEKHGLCFIAIAVITQLKFYTGVDVFKYNNIHYF